MKKLAFVGAVLLIGAFTLLPFLWFFLTSWKSAGEISAIPPVILPSFRWDNYRAAIVEYGLLHYIMGIAKSPGHQRFISAIFQIRAPPTSHLVAQF